jgi:hypothetical protein
MKNIYKKILKNINLILFFKLKILLKNITKKNLYRSKPKSSTWTQVNQIEKDAQCQRPSSRNSQNPKKGA